MKRMLDRLAERMETWSIFGIPLETLCILKLYFAIFYLWVIAELTLFIDILKYFF